MTCIWLNLLTEEKLIHINDAVNKLQVRLLKTTILPQKCAAQTISKENYLRDIFCDLQKTNFLSQKYFSVVFNTYYFVLIQNTDLNAPWALWSYLSLLRIWI